MKLNLNRRVMVFDIRQQDFKEIEKIDEADGKLGSQNEEDKLMKSVLSNDKETIDEGKLIENAVNQGINSFTPDLMFEQLVNNYSIAQKILGPSLIKLATGYNPEYVKKNIKIPEFQRELLKNIQENVDKLKDKDLIDKEGLFTEKGFELSALVTYFEELDKLVPQGILGEKPHKKVSIYGAKDNVRNYKRSDRYRDIAIKKSVKLAIRRNNKKLDENSLKVYERESKGKSYIIYALDASGSMKGSKLSACKRAGIALAYKAVHEKDKVGLISFGSEIKEIVEPTDDFRLLLRNITKIKASRQTDIVATIRKAVEMFPSDDVTKHLILITDALPNIGKNPEKKTLQEVSVAKNYGITISLIGIGLDEKGKKLAEKIIEIGQGRLYVINDLKNIDKVVLEDYYSFN